MKIITLTNSKYQFMCSKSIKSFLRFNDLPVDVYFYGSELENTWLKDIKCHYRASDNSKMPKECRWYPNILKEKLKIFAEQTEDFFFFEPDVFFYKKLDFSIFKDGISGPRIRDYNGAYSYGEYYTRLMNAGFLCFKNVKPFNNEDIEKYFNPKSSYPDEDFLFIYKDLFNFLDLDVCFLNYPNKPFVANPIAVHCIGGYKPFINCFEDPVKQNHYHYNKIMSLGL